MTQHEPTRFDRGATEMRHQCAKLQAEFFANRALIIAANRGPVTFRRDEDGTLTYDRGEGGLVTALLGMCRHTEATWISCAQTEEDAEWGSGEIQLGEDDRLVKV